MRFASEERSYNIEVADWLTNRLAYCTLNSTTFYHYFCAFTDGRHINPSDVQGFPLKVHSTPKQAKIAFTKMADDLSTGMRAATSVLRKSGLLIDSVDSRLVKPIIDSIDQLLATHYGFTDEELDFIINYDIKYRMGLDTSADVDDDVDDSEAAT